MNTIDESCCFTSGILLFFLLQSFCADSKIEIVQKAVGSSLHLIPDHPKQKLSNVKWKLNETTFAEYNGHVTKYKIQEKLRNDSVIFSDINVTITNLQLQNSGTFSIVQQGHSNEQYNTKFIELHVHDIIGFVQIQNNFTWLQSNMCTFHLQCLVSAHLQPTYSWSGHQVGNEPHLYFNLTSAKTATLNCTVNNSVSTNYSVVTVLCTDDERKLRMPLGFSQKYLLSIAVVAGIVGSVMAIGIIGVCYWWRTQERKGENEVGLTVYEDVNVESMVKKKRPESVINGMTTIYETVDDMKVTSNTPQTLYDKISFQRHPVVMPSTSSPYQEVL